ncbi:hypothetical protein GOQ27_15070 [Clostridium sp. D2Q-11]|uniref:Uncharacterized protein n=1 Tax=Anaeromonas frigoriresistens TaxID=2683708 RepID=A0A942UZR8_9FIRM|nr:hypothetical protein [Anaeromonas frigoriresistens]MBS4539794.1 hypothetical protein [Anaeromonas frigoriresistens]
MLKSNMNSYIEEVYGICETEGKGSIREFVKNMDIKNIEGWTNYFYNKYLNLNIHEKVRFWWLLDEYSNLDRIFTRLILDKNRVVETI